MGYIAVKLKYRKKLKNIQKRILNKVPPNSLKESQIYEQIMARYRNALTSHPPAGDEAANAGLSMKSEASVISRIERSERQRSEALIYAWGNFLLFQYYKDNHIHNPYILSKTIEYGESIRKKYEEYPFHEDTMLMLGNIYFFETFDFNNAADIYQELIEKNSNTRWKTICQDRIELIRDNIFDISAMKLYVTAEKYFEEAEFDKAQHLLKEIVKKYPDIQLAGYALYFLGDIDYYKYRDLDRALQYYRVCARKFPDHSYSQTSLYKVGEILRTQKKWEEAIEIYRVYAKKYKSSLYRDDAYYFIGESFQNLGKLREAKNAFSLILGDYPDSKWTDVIYRKLQGINKVLKEL